MSESSKVVLFPILHSNEHDAPADGRHEEEELQQILRQLNTVMSDLAKVKALPRAKVLYESLHPETRHGGDHRPRKQDPRSGSWPCFVDHVARSCGMSRTKVYRQLDWAQRLESLTQEAERAADATGLANQLGILARIAAIPDPAVQQDLALRYDQKRAQVKRELRDREREFGLSSPPVRRKKVPKPSEAEQVPSPARGTSAAGGREEPRSEDAANGDRVPPGQCASPSREPLPQAADSAAIEGNLGTSAVTAHPDNTRGRPSDSAEMDDLRRRLNESEEKRARLEGHIALYEQAPLRELLKILGVTNVNDAIARARSLLEVSDAAE